MLQRCIEQACGTGLTPAPEVRLRKGAHPGSAPATGRLPPVSGMDSASRFTGGSGARHLLLHGVPESCGDLARISELIFFVQCRQPGYLVVLNRDTEDRVHILLPRNLQAESGQVAPGDRKRVPENAANTLKATRPGSERIVLQSAGGPAVSGRLSRSAGQELGWPATPEIRGGRGLLCDIGGWRRILDGRCGYHGARELVVSWFRNLRTLD